MNGLDKLIEKITDDAVSRERELIKNAEAKAEELIEIAKADAKKTGEEILDAADVLAMNIIRGADSASNLEGRKKELAARRAIISEVFENAANQLRSLPKEDYFALLLKMLDKNYTFGEAEIILPEKNKQQMPNEFHQGIAEILHARGDKENNKITISQENAPFERGFILRYKDMEENCSFDSILRTKREELEDRVAKILFTR